MSKCELTLITPPISDAVGFRPLLEAALSGAKVSCVHLRFAVSDERDVQRLAEGLIPMVQERGAAVLLDPPDDLRTVARAGADGVHLSTAEATKSAVEALKPSRIIGVSGLTTRHDAMSVGELDIDYVMFGEPRADGTLPALDRVLERCRWWAEVFMTPCVAYAGSAEVVEPLAATGAEFVALGPYVFAGGPEAARAAVAAAADAARAGAALRAAQQP